MSISLALTNYNRSDLLFESFAQVLEDDRISEIIISDDFSDYEIFRKVLDFCDQHEKIMLYRNTENIGMSKNKAKAVSYAKNDFVILFDSDNILDPSYLDAIPKELSSTTIYCPSFAKPNFDYRKLAGVTIRRHNVHQYINSPTLGLVLNTCNNVVHRDNYLATYEYNPKIKGADSVWFNYLWLKGGGALYIVPGMEYMHKVHAGSEFLKDVDYNMKSAEETRKLIEKL